MDAIAAERGTGAGHVEDQPRARSIVSVESLVKRYGGTVAVDALTFSIAEGEIFGLLGPNGAGKTTTISMIATLLKPDSGSVYVGGFDAARDARRIRPHLGFVPQEIGLFPTLSARENLEYFGGIQGLRGALLRRRIDEALEVAALQDYARKPPVMHFSGGMRRRLNLAAGLIHRPRLLLLDEPTVGVDAQSRNQILESVRRLNREDGMSVVYTTHYMEEAESLCQRVAIMDHGRIIDCDTVEALVSSSSGTIFEVTLAEPQPAFTALLAGMPGILEVHEQGDGRFAVTSHDQAKGLAALVDAAGAHGVRFEALRIVPPSLEQVYLSLTGEALRDEAGA
jgi:ABC-2 type transport system ATP-binding protein